MSESKSSTSITPSLSVSVGFVNGSLSPSGFKSSSLSGIPSLSSSISLISSIPSPSVSKNDSIFFINTPASKLLSAVSEIAILKWYVCPGVKSILAVIAFVIPLNSVYTGNGPGLSLQLFGGGGNEV